ncbi:acyltransferase family protein [Modicisalibacter radicis]|uniref:acyltransferase family protein n=1 Tax=Halomonas sp. EAR18 TaxID=2518972 RepID=UPI00144477AD|nr:acyltransferase family protein [Halomonas sp. EAR18]
MRYRTEVDGLRAIAVSTVLAFHFFPDLVPLGYLGVDLFFVISGFLISTYIIEEDLKSSFSYKKFYWRRVRRILPATLAFLLVTSLFSYYVLTPPDLVKFAKSLIATLTFSANMYFWRTGGYFGDVDALKPLLHMWSLGVEEQFYLVFPFVLVSIMSVFRGHKRLVVAVVFVIAFLSFVANLFLVHIGGSNPAFFLLPARAWQFGAGVLAAFAFRESKGETGVVNTYVALSLVGVGFLLPIPGLPVAVLVTLGLGLFLSQRHCPALFPMRLLTCGSVRKIGLMSFSIYLWHWPVLVFIKYFTIAPPSLPLLVLGLLTTVALAWASYRFVEVPFRRQLTPKIVLVSISSSVMAMALLVTGILTSQGFRWRHPELVNMIASATQSNYRCPLNSYVTYGGSRACFLNDEVESNYSVALIGNSHAQMYAPALSAVLRERQEKGILIPLNDCLPTIDLNISVECLGLARKNYASYRDDEQIKTVIFAMTWYADFWVDETGNKIDDPFRLQVASSILNLVKQMEEAGKEVFLIGPIQIPGTDLASTLSRELMLKGADVETILGELKVSRIDFDKEFGDVVTFLTRSLGEHFIAPDKLLCDDYYCFFGNDSTMFFADSSHLSAGGARLMTPIFDQILGSATIPLKTVTSSLRSCTRRPDHGWQ